MPDEVLIERASDGAATNATHTCTAGVDYTAAVANAERDELIISASVADVWVKLDASAAAVGTGIKVAAAGPAEHITAYKGEVHLISSGAALVGIAETSYHTGPDQGEGQPGADTFTPSGPSDTFSSSATAAAQKDQDWQHRGGSSGVPYPPQP